MPPESFAAFVITYRRAAVLRATLEAIVHQSLPPSRILVIDNGRTAETADVVGDFAEFGAEYHDPGDNLGPAGAAAYALQALGAEGWELVYWGDDDDPPRTPTTLERLVSLLTSSSIPGLAGVGAFGARWDWRHGRYVRLADEELGGCVEVDVIGGNAQLILSSRVVREAGLPNPDLFFGLEEIEYCLRLRRSGYRLAVDGDLMRDYRHETGRLGLPTAPRRLVIPRRNAAAWRQYYSTRNYIYLMRVEYGAPGLARREAVRAVCRAVASWARGFTFGRRYFTLQLLGVVHGFSGKLGRTVAPGDR